MKRFLSVCLGVGLLAAGRPAAGQVSNNLNVVLIVCDDLNDYEGFFGGHPQALTPNMDALAAAGVTFVNAHTSAPICAPSRSSFLTGIYPHSSGNYAFTEWYNNPVLQHSKTLMQYFRDNGYGSFGTGKLMHHRLVSEWTEYGAKAQAGPVAFDGTGFAPHPGIPAPFNAIGELNGTFGSLTNIPSFAGYTGWYKANWVGAGDYRYVNDDDRDPMQDEEVSAWASNKIAELDALGTDTNFFLGVGFSNPHTPLVAPQKYFDLFPVDTLVLPPSISNDVADCYFQDNLGTNTTGQVAYRAMQASWPTFEEGLKLYLQAYLACTAFVDDQIGVVLDALEGSRFASNTVVILTSDHGYEFGEKEHIAKNTLWENSTKVPMVFRVPGLESNAGKTVDEPVGLIDLYPTIRDLCGLTGDTKKDASGADLDGHSMKPFLLDPDSGAWAGPDVALSLVAGSGGLVQEQNYSVRSKNWRYIRYENGQEELYDTANDPHEWTNQVASADAAVQARRDQLEAALFELVPSFVSTTDNLLADSGFEGISGSEPDPDTTPWFTVNEDNIWSYRQNAVYQHSGLQSLTFKQVWDTGSVVQNLGVAIESNASYHASFWMLSHTPGTLSGASTIDLELFSAPTIDGIYTKRGTFVAGAENSTSNIWEQFSGTVDKSLLAGFEGEYLQFRITRPSGGIKYNINVDDLELMAELPAPEGPADEPGSIISLNIHHATASGWNLNKETITDAETYGVASLGTVVGNWNNTNASMSNLLWENGSSSSVGFSTDSTTYATWKAVHNDTPMRAGVVAWTNGSASVTFNNLNANFTNGYAVIVYLSGEEGNAGARISDGTSTFWFQTADPASGALIRTLDTTHADGVDVASYAVFGSAAGPLTNDAVSFSMNSATGAAAFISGVQIVDAATIPYAEPPLADHPLIDFDGLYSPGQLTVDVGTASVVSSNGNSALQLNAAAGETVRVRLAPDSGTWNLVDYVNLAMDIENLGAGEAWLRILIKDPTTQTESWYRPNCSHSAWVQPGETRMFPALMPRLRGEPGNDPGYLELFSGMTGLPHAQMLAWYGVDTTQISEVIIQLEPQETAQTVRIDNLRGNRRAKPTILETDPDAFFPFVDGYGQYIHEDWPGKVTSDAGLLAAKAAEDLDLAANPRTMEFNEYGGWANGPTLPATGHFRTEKIDGKWWFIDPEGKIFWSLGATGIGLTEMKISLDGEEHYYSDLPARDDPVFGAFYTTTGAGAPDGDYFKSFYPVLYKKYGSDFETTYDDRALERIRSWGLNSLGAWSAAADSETAGLKTPYTKIFWTPGKAIPAIPKLDDPFDPGFSSAVVTAIGWTGSANDPYCIGFFDNNEITWGANPARVIQDLLEDSASTDVAAKAELVSFLSGRYANIAAANAAWGSSFADFNDLLPALGEGNFNYPAADADLEAFYAHLTDTYYRKCREALKSAAPNKLYLGSRIYEGSMRKEVAAAAAAHCDVVSFNVYHKDLDEFQGMKARDLPFFTEDKPYLIGEFTFGSLDHGKFWTGIEYAADQRNRGEAYIRFIESGLNDPRCIGAHWFAYDDGATGGHYKPNVSENAGKGLIDSTDTPYYELISAIRATGAGMYAYRYADSVYETSPLLADWQFNETAGAISTAGNSAGPAAWADEDDWTLNGGGQAEVSGVVAERRAAPFSSVTNGSVFMRIDFDSWNFDGDSQVRVGFGLDNQDHFVRLRGRTSAPFIGVGTANQQTVSVVSSNGMSLVFGVDLDADTHSLWWDDGRTGTYVPVVTDIAMATACTSFDAPYFRNSQFTGSNPIGIDMIVYGTNFNDVVTLSALSPYEIWVASYQLTGPDDDFDGLDNLAEFALGGNPTNPSVNGHAPAIVSQGSGLRYVYPRRKDAGLLYWLETSSNLVSGAWTNAGYTVLPDTGAYDADFESVTNAIPIMREETFIRLNVREQ